MGQYRSYLDSRHNTVALKKISQPKTHIYSYLRMKKLIVLTMAFIGLYLSSSPSSAVPVKFMCDMCESNWIHCMMKCHMEEYMTRHNYENQVYVGAPKVKPKKNHLDMMFEHIMHSTGHDHM